MASFAKPETAVRPFCGYAAAPPHNANFKSSALGVGHAGRCAQLWGCGVVFALAVFVPPGRLRVLRPLAAALGLVERPDTAAAGTWMPAGC